MSKELTKLLDVCLEKNLNFVAFSLPNQDHFEIIIEHHLLCSNVKSGFVFHPFEVSDQFPEVFIHADFRINSNLITDNFIDGIRNLESIKKVDKTPAIYSISKENYLKELTTGIEILKTEKLDKFIYSRIKTVENTSDLDLSNFLMRLNESNKKAFGYLINHQNSGIWIGATPETLAKWNGNTISTMSLAGTQPNNGKSPKWTAKEIEEQAYVTNYIKKAFENNNIQYQASEVSTIQAGPVFHLQTNLSSISAVSFAEAQQLVYSLHPTPAICGVPLQKAKETIAKLESHERSYYTGYLGIINPNKELNLFVNLRCMQVLPNSLALYLGGGITANSDAEKEWDETNFKAQTLLNVLQ